MVLAIALFVFSVILLVVFIGFYLWWKKFGKEMFNMVKNMGNPGKLPIKPINMGDITKQMDEFMKIFSKNIHK
jgi:hypothetical protein